jgi:HlyD family secretion protein
VKTLFALLFVIVLLAAGGAYFAVYRTTEPPLTFQTVPVKRGTLFVTTGATGTAEPEDLIDVGTQVTGRILAFGQDPHNPNKLIDYGTEVEKDTLLATIDPTIYNAQVDQASAALAHAKADLVQLEAKRDQTELEWKRAQVLRPKAAIAETEFDLARANYYVAKANVEVGKAEIQQCEATLAMAKINQGYTSIKSPVKGVIIARRMNVGQTAVSSMSAQSLFLLAKDLSRMQVWAQVNEADIGPIHAGLPVHFTLATYPGETFKGKVVQVRLNAQSTQNVITYTVVVATDNPPSPDHPYGKIYPYMTADVRFEVEKHADVLMVPSSALRWIPQPAEIAPDVRPQASGRSPKALGGGAEAAGGTKPKPDARSTAASDPATPRVKHNRVWIVDGDFVRPVKVIAGATDGISTEISGEDVKDGMQVVIGESRTAVAADDEATTNPFIPNIQRGRNAKPKTN